MPNGKNFDLDGLNIECYLFFWDDISDHLFSIVQIFFSNSVMSASYWRTYVSLIPKKPNPKYVSDFRMISLSNVSYQIISKILANHLKPYLPHLISREKTGFVSGHNPFDNIISIQEIAHSLIRILDTT